MQGNAPDEERIDPHGECRHEIERLRAALEPFCKARWRNSGVLLREDGKVRINLVSAELHESVIEAACAALTN